MGMTSAMAAIFYTFMYNTTKQWMLATAAGVVLCYVRVYFSSVLLLFYIFSSSAGVPERENEKYLYMHGMW